MTGNFCSSRDRFTNTVSAAGGYAGFEVLMVVRSRYSDGLWRGARDLSLLQCFQVRLWGSPNLSSNGYRVLFPQSGWGLNLTTHLHLVLRLRMVELYLHSPVCLHGVVLTCLNTGTTLPFTMSVTQEFGLNDSLMSRRNILCSRAACGMFT
jgi:hypothetical protein